ncbi:MAG TPA: NADH-quinone oxidoreductase subunit J [Gemmatimonadaceae bacterium]|nr:NADH-quinone oxidoreductase subunit J [Gemmatimonadaceae bacterium]
MIDPPYPLFYTFHFYLFGVIALASALAFVTRKSPVAAALWLVNVMFALAALYVMLDAHFIAAIQVLVYAGAIMVVFLFVIMLLNLGHPSEIADARGKWGKAAAAVLGFILLAEIAVISGTRINPDWVLPRGEMERLLAEKGAIGVVADPLFTRYLLAFELTSILLLIAIVGAVALGRRGDAAAVELTPEEQTNAG